MEDRHYFTRSDATIRLLTHPDERWRGETVDAPYFRITAAGRAPIHIWNYARRDAGTMSNESQNARLEALQEGSVGGSPFDDTALSDARYELQIMLNEQRFEETYYQFRTMSEVGNVLVKYEKVAGWEDQARAGYTLVGGRVGSVGREVNVQGSAHPSVELTFEDMYPLGSERPLGTPARPGFAPSRDVGVGVGDAPAQPAFRMTPYQGWVDGKKVNPSLTNVPHSIEGYDELREGSSRAIAGTPDEWAARQDFFAPVFAVESERGTRKFFWNPDEGSYQETSSRSGAFDKAPPVDSEQAPNQDPTSATESLLDVIKKFEGFREKWYEDPPGSGKYSIAYGLQSSTLSGPLGVTRDGQPFTRSNFPDAVVSPNEAEPWLQKDVQRRMSEVEALLEDPRDATQHELDAMTALAYNIGIPAFEDSTLLEKYNAGDKEAAAQEFMEWVNSGGERNETLVERRRDEKDMFLNNDYNLTHYLA